MCLSTQIQVCKMVKGRSGSYKRDGIFHEIELQRDSTYRRCVTSILKDNEFERDANFPSIFHSEQEWTLFTVSGSKLRKHMRDGEKIIDWTLGEYMKRHNYSPAQTRIGIGIVDVHKVQFASIIPCGMQVT